MQITAPPGCEAAARKFFGELLGMQEIPKPQALRERGGVWFDCGAQQLHVGVEKDFSPNRKAHPAIAVTNLAALKQKLLAAGVAVVEDENVSGSERFYASDPFGNRIEFIEKMDLLG